MKKFPEEFIDDKGVRTDWIDLRDQQYLPNLSVLRSSVSMDPKLMRDLDEDEAAKVRGIAGQQYSQPIFDVRNQGANGRCVGFALANLVDIQRNLQRVREDGPPPILDPEVEQAKSEAQKKKDAEEAEKKLRADRLSWRQDIVSADMLYRMAFFHDRYPDLEDPGIRHKDGVRTLRSGIKGFYHHGVCMDWPETTAALTPDRWQSVCYSGIESEHEPNFPTVDQAKSARQIGLGAYFRLSSVLNHFHAALNDVEAVLVSANIHDGWREATPENGGIITWPPRKGKIGTHAFVLVGYNQDGFLVLNSWGPEWGGYNGQLGIALWSYKDWAQNVVDSWVLRLGVPAPEAFGASIGEKGTKGLTGPVQVGSMPCSELVGHYMHLDDGFHVVTGSYPTFDNSWCKTREYLEGHIDKNARVGTGETKYRGILVWIPGSFEGIKPAFAAAVQRKNLIKNLGLYPYTIFWCNSFVEKSMEVMNVIFDSCKEQAGSDAEHLNELIEGRVRGVGRAFWRDIEIGARRTLRGTGELPFEPDDQGDLDRIEKGFVARFLADLMELKHKTKCEIHIVAQGAGALVVHEMLALLKDDAEYLKELEKRKKCTCGLMKKDKKKKDDEDEDEPQFKGRKAEDFIDTLHLIQPAIGLPRAQKCLLPFVNKVNGTIKGEQRAASRSGKPVVKPLIRSNAPRRARIYIPDKKLEERICFGIYGKSILHLISRSFEDRYAKPPCDNDTDIPVFRDVRKFVGMASIIDPPTEAEKAKMAELKAAQKKLRPEDKPFDAHGAVYRLNRVASQKHEMDRVPQDVLSQDPTITEEIFDFILSRRK